MFKFTGSGWVGAVALNESGNSPIATFSFTIAKRFGEGEPIVFAGKAFGKVALEISRLPEDSVVAAIGSVTLDGEGKQKLLGVTLSSIDLMDTASASRVHSIALAGRLGEDPDVRFLDSGKKVARFSIAVNRGRDKAPYWASVKVCGKLAELADLYLKKGQLLSLFGYGKLETWQDGDEARSKFVVVAEDLTLPRRSESEPQARAPQSMAQQPKRSTPMAAFGIDEDHLPF